MTSPVRIIDVKINGTTQKADFLENLVTLTIDHELRLPAQCMLRLSYPNDPNAEEVSDSFTPKMGTPVSVEVDGSALFSGEVTAVELNQTGLGGDVTITALDLGHRLSRPGAPKFFVEMKLSDVVQQVASKAGLTARCDASQAVLPALAHVRSDSELLNAASDATGFDWWVEAVDGPTLMFAKPGHVKASVDLNLGDTLLSWKLRISEPPIKKVIARSRNPELRKEIVATATTPAAAVKSSTSMIEGELTGSGEIHLGTIPLTDQTGLQAAADAYLSQVVGSSVRGVGVCLLTPSLRLGGKVKVTGAGRSCGTFPVTRVEHIFRGGDWESRFHTGARNPTGMFETGGARTRPVGSTTTGLVAAIVTNINDPKKLNRVKLKFPTLSNDLESDWARIIVVGGGGGGRGSVSLPEVNDEVLVGFEGGSLAHPVVLGGLYGDKAKPPPLDVANGAVPTRRITSREGHYVELSDGPGLEKNHVKLGVAKSSHNPVLRLGGDKSSLTFDTNDFTIKGGKTEIIVKADGDVEIKGMNVTITAIDKLALKAANVEISANVGVKVKGVTIEVAAQATAKVESSGVTEIKGGMVEIN